MHCIIDSTQREWHTLRLLWLTLMLKQLCSSQQSLIYRTSLLSFSEFRNDAHKFRSQFDTPFSLSRVSWNSIHNTIDCSVHLGSISLTGVFRTSWLQNVQLRQWSPRPNNLLRWCNATASAASFVYSRIRNGIIMNCVAHIQGGSTRVQPYGNIREVAIKAWGKLPKS